MQNAPHNAVALGLVLDALEGESHGERLVIGAVIGYRSAVIVGILHGRECGINRLDDFGVLIGIVLLVQLAMEGELQTETVDRVALQRVGILALIG